MLHLSRRRTRCGGLWCVGILGSHDRGTRGKHRVGRTRACYAGWKELSFRGQCIAIASATGVSRDLFGYQQVAKVPVFPRQSPQPPVSKSEALLYLAYCSLRENPQ